MARRQFYQPASRGFEREVQKRLDYWAKLRAERREKAASEDPT
jgi:putative ATPase